jgi:hypothetical protein
MTKLAFTRRTGPGDNDEIYVMNADGSSPTRLTYDVRSDASPAWQPLPVGDTDGDGVPDATDNCPGLRAIESARRHPAA